MAEPEGEIEGMAELAAAEAEANTPATVEELESGALGHLSTLAKAGDASAAAALLRALEGARDRGAAEAHRQKMQAAEMDPVALAGYLGECGMVRREVALVLGHTMTEEERTAHERGAVARRLEIQALQLARTRRGWKPEEWMFR